MRLGILVTAFAALLLISVDTVPANAQTSVRFVLDFLLQGQQSPFVLGREKGYYTAQKVEFSAFDAGRGGADSITKVASGTYDIGFGDLSSLIEYNARNPGHELIAVVLIYDRAPLSLISLKKNNIVKPVDLIGRKGGAPSVDATYRLFNGVWCSRR
jgi:NitT/TauT family transport system substrate-binding protein